MAKGKTNNNNNNNNKEAKAVELADVPDLILFPLKWTLDGCENIINFCAERRKQDGKQEREKERKQEESRKKLFFFNQ